MQLYPPPSTARSLPLPLGWLVRLRSAHAWILILLCADFAAIGDVITGPNVWFGPAYQLVICLAAWCLGWRAGHLTGLGCMVLTFAINGVTLYPYGTFDFVWNFVVRFAAISIVIAVIAGSRRAYIREWWLARTDPLTGALNRQAFFELSAGLAKVRCWRLLIYADLDGLKRINDRHGHAAGDRSLKVFAAEVRNAIRRDDIFARVGGDEFLVLMPVRDQASATALATRLHDRMNSLLDESGADLRCSVGALIVPPGEVQIDYLVGVADNLMYQAKLQRAGLQVEVAEAACEAATSGRARKAARVPLPNYASTQKLRTERRIKIEIEPRGKPTQSDPVMVESRAA